MKIVYCTDTVCYPGGIQMVTMVKANALAKIPGNQVWIVVTDHKKEPLIPLENVELVNLDVNYYEDDWKGYWYVLKGIFQKRKMHKKRLLRFLNDIAPDIVVSTGTSEKNFLPYLSVSSHPVFIREIHFEKNYRVRHATSLMQKLTAKCSNWYDYRLRIKKYDRIVVLTEGDKSGEWADWEKVVVLPNPIVQECVERAKCETSVAITAGRLTPIKNFSSLIRVWKLVVSKHPDWVLQIWGDGGLRCDLGNQIKALGLKNSVFLKGYSNHIIDEYLQASMLLISSLSEGFGLAMVEAMSVGLPVVSYDCPGSPRYIIENKKTGFLIPMHDEAMFAEKICTLIEDEEMRKRMGHQAWLASQDYQLDKIITRWMRLFEGLRAEKKSC